MAETTDILRKIKSEFDFEINRLPLSGPDNLTTPWYGLFRGDNGEAIGKPVHGGYVPHSVEHIQDIVGAAINAFDEADDVSCHFNGGHYVSISPTRKYRKTVAGTDTVWPRLIIRAGLGGTSSFNCTIGYYRDRCKNLAMLQSARTFSIRYRHTSGIGDRLDHLVEDLHGLKEGWDSLSNIIDRMHQREVSISDIISRVYGQTDPNDSKRKRTLADNRVEKIVRRLLREREYNQASYMNHDFATGWEMYNAIQGYHLHDAPTRGARGTESQMMWDRVISTAVKPEVKLAEELVLAV